MARRSGSSAVSKGGAIFLVLFGLPFLGVGTFAIYMGLSSVLKWHEASSWEEHEAFLESLDLETHRGSEGGSTYEVVATYRYVINGVEYRSEDVSIHSGSDNIGKWQRMFHARLKRAQAKEETVPCYVDPLDPSRAVLSRELRAGMLLLWIAFGSVFGIAGLAVSGAGIFSSRKASRKKRSEDANPGKPWLWKEDWAKGRVPAGTGTTAIVMWAVAVFWNGISFPISILLIPEAVGEGQYWTLIFLLFPLIGLVILYFAVTATIGHIKFGRSYLELKTLPARIGGSFAANVILCGPISRMEKATTTLACQETVTRGSGKNSSTSKEDLWKEEKEYGAPGFSMNRASIGVEFDVPGDMPPTNNNGIDWELRVKAAVPGVDVDLKFEVPVFKE